MFNIDKIVSLPDSPFSQRGIDVQLLELCEKVTPFKPISYLDYKRLPSKNGRLRFHIVAAYGHRDK